MESELLTSQDQACERAQDILFIARFTEDPMEERPVANSHTLESFIEEVYQPWAETNLRSGARTVARIRASFAEHLGRKLGELTRWTVEEWRAARIKDGVSAATVYRDLGALRSALARAVTWRLLDASPIPAVNRSKIGEMRGPRFLSADEEGRLRVALDDREERLRRERDKANAWRAARVYEPLPDLSVHFCRSAETARHSFVEHRNAARRTVRAHLAKRRPNRRADHPTRFDG
jgi:hypothetical protein